MTTMKDVIAPNSMQVNADDLIAGPKTIRITKVTIAAGGEQRVSVFFEGDNGKPWKPCKSMCRVLVEFWGPDKEKYVGKSLTLFRNPKVKWAGLEVGGIQISHMSHIERDMVTAITESQKKRSAFIVKQLRADEPPPPAPKKLPAKVEAGVQRVLADIEAADSLAALEAIMSSDSATKQMAWLHDNAFAAWELVINARRARIDALTPPRPDREPGEDDL